MAIVDENNFLSEEEQEIYHKLLKIHGHHPHHFILEVKEDQSSVDMHDIHYVVIITAQATHVGSQKSKTYVSRAGSGTWLVEFEGDLKKGYFEKDR